MSLRIITGLLLAGIAWSASSQEYGTVGQGFAATGWATPGAYGDFTPPPSESQNRTHYDGKELLEEVTDQVSGDLDKQLQRELGAGQQVERGNPTTLVGE